MKRYYSHYTYIYPDTYLKDSVVQMDDSNNITEIIPFKKEIENTSFHAGLMIFIPNTMRINPYLINCAKEQIKIKFDTEASLPVKAVICNLED